MSSGCRVNVKWMLSGCKVDVKLMLSECRVVVEWMSSGCQVDVCRQLIKSGCLYFPLDIHLTCTENPLDDHLAL